ncbi:unnamed protein product [Aphanomyces euteiches]
MDALTCEFYATKAELQACRDQLESTLSEKQEKAEHVNVMVSCSNNAVDGQLKPQLEEAQEVEALATRLTSVNSQLTKKIKFAERLSGGIEDCTWITSVVANDKNDQDVKRKRWSVRRMSVFGLLVVSVTVVVLLCVATIAINDGTVTHPLHDVTSGPLR